MDSNPLVSVILPMFNSERFIEQAVRSILAQSYENLECIIVDDGCSDRSWEIAKELQKIDPRIQLIRLEKNQGVSAASNIALQASRGKYIARMDADDISVADRFSLQVRYMEAHPEAGILGGGIRYMDENGKLSGAPPILKGDTVIRWYMLFENPFFNPTVMFRKSIIDHFGFKYETANIYGEEDYDYVSRLITRTKGDNLPDILLYYRLHPSSLSYRYADERNKSVVGISCRAVEALLPEVSASHQEIADLQRAFQGTSATDKRRRSQVLPVYLKLWNAFYSHHKHEPEVLSLKREVIAWAARMILYPPFQDRRLEALKLLTRTAPGWPLFLLLRLPYYLARRLV